MLRNNEKIECPYCHTRYGFFVHGGAIYLDEPRYRERLALTCMRCKGEFVFIDENARTKVIPYAQPIAISDTDTVSLG